MPTIERPAMADYGVPAGLEGTLPWAWADERLVANKNYWVITASAKARPHAMPVWGVWIPDTERFWFSCAPGARKVRNLVANPQCVVTVTDTVECVVVEGRARIADLERDAEVVDHAVATYVQKYWTDAAVHTDMTAFVRSNLIVEITPDVAFGIIEREDEFNERATRWRW